MSADLFQVAADVARSIEEIGSPYAFIGGIAVQVRGEPRVTRDVDLSVFVDFGDEELLVNMLLRIFKPRKGFTIDFALKNRVVLLQSEHGTGIDIGLACFPFESTYIERATYEEIVPGTKLRVISSEDLICLKLWAARGLDGKDARSVMHRNWPNLDWPYMEHLMTGLEEMTSEPGLVASLLSMKRQVEEDLMRGFE